MIASGTVDTIHGKWKWQLDIGHAAKLVWAIEAPDGSKRAGIFGWDTTVREAREHVQSWIRRRVEN